MPFSKDTKPAHRFNGEIHIDAERCKGCGYCITFCPMKVLGASEEFNSKGYHPPVVLDPDACVGCNLCGLYCPDFAIYSIRIDNNENDNQESKPNES